MRILLAVSILSSGSAFLVKDHGRPSTVVFLDDHIADMIDRELWREHHKKEFENEWMEKNRGAILSSLNADTVMTNDEDQSTFRQVLKDRKLAKEDPAAYCADRCVTTGNCDVYEDL